MKSLSAAAYLWAYDTGSRWGFNLRPRTLLILLAVLSILGLVPAFGLGMLAGEFVAGVGIMLPIVLIAGAWSVWGIVRVTVSGEREELTAPPLAHFLAAVDLPFVAWFTVRFALPLALEALYVGLIAGGFLLGSGSDLDTVLPTYLVLALGYLTRLAVSAQLSVHRTGLWHAATLVLSVAPFLALFFLHDDPLWTTLAGLSLLSVVAAAYSIELLLREQYRVTATAKRRHRRAPVATGPKWWSTAVALRAGVWVPPVRALSLRVLTLCVLLASMVFVARMASSVVSSTLEMVTPAIQAGLGYVAFILALMIADLGVSWYGARSRRRELRVAWEAGASETGLVVGSMVAHIADAALVLAGVCLIALGFGVPVTLGLAIVPISAVLASACGYALFAAPELPDGRARLSLPGTIAGLIMAVPALVGALNASLLWLAAVVLLLLLGGVAWSTRKVITDASFSIM